MHKLINYCITEWASEWTGGRFLNFIALITCMSYHEIKTMKMIGNKEIDGMHKQLLTYFTPWLVLTLQ